MNDTPHIKRFEEYPRSAPFGRVPNPTEAMLNNLAEHVERLEARTLEFRNDFLDHLEEHHGYKINRNSLEEKK